MHAHLAQIYFAMHIVVKQNTATQPFDNAGHTGDRLQQVAANADTHGLLATSNQTWRHNCVNRSKVPDMVHAALSKGSSVMKMQLPHFKSNGHRFDHFTTVASNQHVP